MISNDDFKIEIAASGFEAGIQAESIHPDCVVVDFVMGREEALMIAQNLRRNTEFNETVLIGLLSDDDNASGFDRSVFSETFRKPFDAALLAERIRTLVKSPKAVGLRNQLELRRSDHVEKNTTIGQSFGIVRWFFVAQFSLIVRVVLSLTHKTPVDEENSNGCDATDTSICLAEITFYVHCAVKNSQDFNTRLGLDQIGDAIVAVEDLAYDVVVDFFKTVRRRIRPHYFCHESILVRTSESVSVRPASESANPRSTIWAKASSRRISS
jgi:CheY-like chemotaxis protein